MSPPTSPEAASREQVVAAVRAAVPRLRPWVRTTPLELDPGLSELTGGEVWLKLENLQRTGSFKVRGALNKLLCLSPDERRRGVVAASTGNHGAAVAFGLARLGIPGVVFVPEGAEESKIAAIRRHGAEIRTFGKDGALTEGHARSWARRHGRIYVSPYNDLEVIAGQGTLGRELSAATERHDPGAYGAPAGPFDAVVVALGGGGLAAGVGAWLKARHPTTRLIAASPTASPVLQASLAAGRILELPSRPTLSDGTAGGLEPGAITFPLCRDLVDHHVLVTEDEIRAAVVRFLADHRQVCEGAAGVALAAVSRLAAEEPSALAGRRLAVIVCGANLGLGTLHRLLAEARIP